MGGLAACAGRGGEGTGEVSAAPTDVPSPSSAAPETTAPPTTTTTTVPKARSPLTGLEVPADADLGRPALAVKIDNHPDAVPQVGLDQTDLVFEERVEGITRFLAVFWSHDVAGVGPIRSARTSDIDLLGSLGEPLLAWSGGNEGVVDAVESSDVIDVGVDHQPDLYSREPSRYAPHNLMSDTAQLVAAGREGASPPQSPFAVANGASPGAAAVAAPGLDVDLDGVTADWVWDAASSRWLRFQNGEAHLAESGAQLSAANVVVLGVDYASSSADASSPEAQSVGEGAGVVLRPDGTMVEVTWQRGSGNEPFVLVDAAGAEVVLPPGNIWVELPRHDRVAALSIEQAAQLLASR